MRATIEQFFMRAWLRRGWLARLLWPLAAVFKLVLNFRFGLYMLGYKPQTTLAVPVIVVGNIFIGGTGKTPLVIWLVQRLRAAGWHPGVVSRGYGAAADAVHLVRQDSNSAQAGDEPLLIAQRTGCPVAVGRHRVAAAQALLAAHPDTDVLIADDGLQHYALARDAEIVVFDARGCGNGWLLPAGPLREPPQRRRDFTILNAAPDTQVPGLPPDTLRMTLAPGLAYRLGDPANQLPLAQLRGRRLVAAAGIGNPQRFFDSLTAVGLEFHAMPLPDHYVFDAGTFANVSAEAILITEKDAVKCREIAALRDDPRLWVATADAVLDADLATQLIHLISEKTHGSTFA